jgi:hypothetical protein
LTESQSASPSYFSNVIEIYRKGHLFSRLTRLMKDFTFRADNNGPSIAELACAVYIHEIALVHDGICLSEDEFL